MAALKEVQDLVHTIDWLYEAVYGHKPDGTDKAKAAEYVKWRYGGQGFLDAVKVVQELRTKTR